MNIPDIDGFYDDQLVVDYNCCKLPQHQPAMATNIDDSKILTRIESCKNLFSSINNCI